MAKTNGSDLFSFVIRPEFSTENVDDSAKILSDELERIAEKITKQISDKMGSAFKLPANFDPKDIQQVTELIAQLGGQVTRTGTNISASFKDAQGNVVKITDSVKTAIDIIDEYYKKLQQQGVKTAQGVNVSDAISKIETFRTTGKTYTGSEEIQEQQQLEQQIIKSLQERYNLEGKITDAKASGNKIAETYYTQLRNIAVTEEQQLESQYKGSQIRINSTKQQLSLEQQLRQQKAQSTAEEDKAVEAVKQYAKQYQTIKQLESKGQQNTQAYTDAKNALQQLTTTLSQYGVQVVTSSDGTTKLVAQQNSMADSSNKVKTALDNANGSLLKTDTAQNSLTKTIQDSVENFLKYQVAMEAINKITSEFTQAIGDMNSAMAQVRMVTMGSYEDTVALADSYTQLAKQLGTTTTEVAKGADTWLRQGYSAQDAMEMLKQSTTLAVVGQLSAEDAVNDLTAVTKSYNTTVEDTSKVVDKLVSVDLNYAAFVNKLFTI